MSFFWQAGQWSSMSGSCACGGKWVRTRKATTTLRKEQDGGRENDRRSRPDARLKKQFRNPIRPPLPPLGKGGKGGSNWVSELLHQGCANAAGKCVSRSVAINDTSPSCRRARSPARPWTYTPRRAASNGSSSCP